jgi:enoyl-CoA hydratase
MVRVERRGDVAVWTIARPQAKNALSMQTLGDLARVLDEARADATLRAAVLTGEGDAFVSGGDLRELRAMTSDEDAARFADAGIRVCGAIESLPVPVIAALPGVAYGGGAELAVACDLRVADPSARVAFKQVRMGVTTAWGTIGRLVSLVGAGGAARLLYAGHEVDAATAREMGLVDAVSEPGGCVERALAWAGDVALGSPDAVREMKALLVAARVDVGARERARFVATWTGADHAEAMEAFFAKRAPRWSRA